MISDLWYKNAIIYSLDLQSFMDLNGDGIGDFVGLSRRMDYLDALGIDTVWLAPFQPTPNKDNGYDISDYYGVDPRHGSSGDFVEFMKNAKKNGLKVIMDLVVNHTSDKHPWFIDASSSKDSKHRDWYVWSDKKPADWDKGMVFPGVQKETWTYHKKTQSYYHHRFYSFQPDLNMDNPEVREEIKRIMGYWIELGVDGFRMDAVPFVLESTKSGTIKFEYLMDFRNFVQWRKGDAILLGEANVSPEKNELYFGEKGEGIHMMFNFFVNQHVFYTLATSEVAPLAEAIKATRIQSPSSQWANFLRNHDELDLGRLSQEQLDKVNEKFAPEKNMRLYERGIRRRLAPLLGNRDQIELAYSLMFSLPGAPVIRYGDEINMGDNLKLKERDAVRTPMHWSNAPQAGFSEAKKLIYPVIETGPYAYNHVNVDDDRRRQDSMLNWMINLIRLRKECPEIGLGQWQIIKVKEPEVLVMHYFLNQSSLIVLHNFDDKVHEIDLDLKQDGTPLEGLLDLEESKPDEKGIHHIKLEAFGYRWFRAGNLGHLFIDKRPGQLS